MTCLFSSEHREQIGRMSTVYPGHPCLIAMQIMAAFCSPGEALAKTTHGWPAALSHSNVRGAGGAVHQGVDVIRKLTEAPDRPNEAFEWGAEMWRRSRSGGDFREKLEEGIQAAEDQHDEFIDMAMIWAR